MPQLFRLGCAGVAVIAVAALTSIGLYAVVAGGVPFGAPSPRATPGAPTVLVTIQAAPVTPTLLPIPTWTPMPSSLIPGLGQPPAPALVAPSPAASSTTLAQASSTPPPVALTASPAGAASPSTEGTANSAPPEVARQASHDGLTLEVVEAARSWQATGADGAPIGGRDGFELLTVHVRLVNRASDVRYVADSDIVVVADDGARFASRQVPPLREPYLLTLPVPPGDGVRGWLTYEVPAGSLPRRLQWSPTTPDRPRAETTFILALP